MKNAFLASQFDPAIHLRQNAPEELPEPLPGDNLIEARNYIIF